MVEAFLGSISLRRVMVSFPKSVLILPGITRSYTVKEKHICSYKDTQIYFLSFTTAKNKILNFFLLTILLQNLV